MGEETGREHSCGGRGRMERGQADLKLWEERSHGRAEAVREIVCEKVRGQKWQGQSQSQRSCSSPVPLLPCTKTKDFGGFFSPYVKWEHVKWRKSLILKLSKYNTLLEKLSYIA